jgi:hypothetical protein
LAHNSCPASGRYSGERRRRRNLRGLKSKGLDKLSIVECESSSRPHHHSFRCSNGRNIDSSTAWPLASVAMTSGGVSETAGVGVGGTLLGIATLLVLCSCLNFSSTACRLFQFLLFRRGVTLSNALPWFDTNSSVAYTFVPPPTPIVVNSDAIHDIWVVR